MLRTLDKAITIRSFTPGDGATCRRLYFDGLIGGKICDNDTALDLDNIESVYMRSPGNHFWVAECDDAGVVGMVGVQHHDEGVGEVRRLRVAGTHRRRGVGGALVEAALTFCVERGYLKITLDTYMEREPAMDLFEKFHFRHYRTRAVGGRELMYFYLDLYTSEQDRRPLRGSGNA